MSGTVPAEQRQNERPRGLGRYRSLKLSSGVVRAKRGFSVAVLAKISREGPNTRSPCIYTEARGRSFNTNKGLYYLLIIDI